MRALPLVLLMLLGSCALTPKKRVLESPSAPAAIGPYSQGIGVGPLVALAGQIGLDPACGQLVSGGVAAETRRALANLEAVLASDGLELSDVVSTTVYLVDMGEFATMNAAYAESFADRAPARATVGVAALPKGARVEISAWAVRSR